MWRTLVVSKDAQALRYIFLAEREAAHINLLSSSQHHSPFYFDSYPGMKTQKFPASLPGKDWFVPKYTDPTGTGTGMGTRSKNMINQNNFEIIDVHVVGVVGTGVMGSGIAASLLMGRCVIEVFFFINFLWICFDDCCWKILLKSLTINFIKILIIIKGKMIAFDYVS